MSAAITTPGDRLKAERERRELSAQKAADQLHLDAWVIDALEAEDYERIGPSVYAKGHLKRYATLLGLPAPEYLAAYEARVQGPKPAAPAPPANVRLTRDTPAVNNLPWAPIAGCAAAVLLILGILWWKPWHQRGANLVSNPAASPSASAAVPENAAPDNAAPDFAAPDYAVKSDNAAAPDRAGPRPTAQSDAAPAAPAPDVTAGMGHARLRMSFSADSWVDVHDAAGHLAFSGNGRANSVKTIAGLAPLRVYLRSVSGVQLEINNRAVAIGPQFVNGDVARFEAGADGVLRRDSPGVQSRNLR